MIGVDGNNNEPQTDDVDDVVEIVEGTEKEVVGYQMYDSRFLNSAISGSYDHLDFK